ncbi:MAG: sigma-70 family RNA polymerase sigma factor [Saprospiraceae bacterium]|nr:sigma-70 family RNA polymerase sigma factor [Saprospiraceae bacterium]
MENNEDIQLWSRLKAGDRQAFDIIYRRYADTLYKYGSRFSKDGNTVEDAIHDLFVYIWKQKANLSDTDSIKAYLLFALRNRLLKDLKNKNRIELKDEDPYLSEKEMSAEASMIRNEEEVALNFALKKSLNVLSNREREVMYLKYFDGMSYEDICQIMNINYQSVRNLVSRSLKKLHGELKKS